MGDTGNTGAVDAGETGWIEEAAHVEQNEQVVTRPSESLDRPRTVGSDRVRSRVDLVDGNADDLRNGVDHAAHRAVANVDDDRTGVGVGLAGAEPKEQPKVDDGNDRAAEIAHPDDVGGHVRNPGHAAGRDDLLDPFDAKQVFLTVDLETDELGRGGLFRV
jgi:hypothetical protein